MLWRQFLYVLLIIGTSLHVSPVRAVDSASQQLLTASPTKRLIKPQDESLVNRPRYVSNEILFSMKRDSADARGLAKKIGIESTVQLAAGKHKKPWKSIYKAHLKPGISPEEASKKLKGDPDIEWAEPNYLRYVDETVPNDTSYNSQMYLRLIGASYGWDRTTGSRDVVIAVIDTGVQLDHPDLTENIWSNPGETAGDGIDNDGNGFIDDIHGWDFVSAPTASVYQGEDPGPRDNDPSDFYGHGTHVAGIAGAVGNNGIGITGINWQTSIMPVRAGYKDNYGYGVLQDSDIVDALIYAADNGTDVINMSFGGSEFSHAERAAIDYCVSAGSLPVASAGNASTDEQSYPAAFDNVVAVASVSSWGNRSYYSNIGLWVDIAAPGDNVYSTIPGGTYGYKTGTSMASPMIAGTAALMKAAHPEWGPEQLKLKLLSSTSDFLPGNGSFTGLLGSGLVGIDNALNDSIIPDKTSIASIWLEETSGIQDGAFDPDETVKMLISVRNFGRPVDNVSLSVSTSDPYVTLSDGTSIIGSLGTSSIKTNADDPVVFSIASNVPKDHIAGFTVSLYVSGSAVGTPESRKIRLNPILRNRLQLTYHPNNMSYIDPSVTARPAGGAVVLYHSNEFAENQVYAQLVDASGVWTPAVKVSSSPNITAAREQHAAVSPDGRVHVSFVGYTGSSTGEIFHVTMDPSTGAWSSPVPVSSGAKVYDSNRNDVPNAIAVDPAGNPHIAWVDYRGGSPEIYYSYYDGSLWSSAVSIAAPGTGPASMFLGFTSMGDGYLVWNQPDAGSNSIKMMKLSGGVWSPMTDVAANADANHLACTVDSQDRLHVAFTGPSGGDVSYIQLTGDTWSQVQTIFTNTHVIGTGTQARIAIAPDGVIHVARCAAPGWSTGDYTIQAYDTVYQDGSWQAQVPLTFDRMGYGLDSADVAVDSLGTMFLTGETENYPYDIVLLSSEVNPSRLPSRPEVTVDGQVTSNPYSLQASWSSFHASGIAEYKYAVGTAPGEADQVYWRSAGTNSSMTVDMTDTPLLAGRTYYISIQAKNNLGFWSPIGTSSGITYNYQQIIGSIQGVKAAATGQVANITSSIVTAAFPDFFYIESDDRSCGIRVNKAGHGLSADMRADVTGTVGTTANGEKCIDASGSSQNGVGSVQPLGMMNRELGGGPIVYNSSSGTGQEGIEGSTGLNNTGLLIKTWGKVISSPVVAFWNLDSDPGWSLQGQWEYGVPMGVGGSYGRPDPTSGHTGTNVFGVNLNGEYSSATAGPYYLTTAPIDCSGKTSVTLKFWRWLNTDYQPYVEAKVQVSSDDVNWDTIWDNGSTRDTTDSAWTFCTYDISATAANQPAVYIRWIYKVANGALPYSGWNIDDIEVSGVGGDVLISDGSGSPIKLAIPTGVAAPPVGSYVTATGISSCERDEQGKLRSLLRVRKAEDIRVQ